MSTSSLKQTKIRLTVIFTLLVLAIAVLLEGVFFTAKYVNYISNESRGFDLLTNSIEKDSLSVSQLVTRFDIDKRILKLGDGMHPPKERDDERVSLLIIDNNKKELVFTNIVDNLSIDFVNELLSFSYGKVEQDDGYLVKKINIKEGFKRYDILFIKNLRYTFSDYLTDLLGFVFITILFSALFYYSGYKFVSKNLEPVEENLKDMQDFVHNAGHELKTPISIIHSNLQLIKELKSFEKDLINEGLIEINRLDHLIESLVELSNINSGENKGKVNLQEEIKLIIKDFKTESDKKEIDIKFKKKIDKVLIINKQYFYILFSNLLGNAIKYTEKGGKIEITLEDNFLSIKDNGIGIKEEYKTKIFDRFFMGTKSRNMQGYGIGLSLVKKIADIYNWKIDLKSEEARGTEFIVKF